MTTGLNAIQYGQEVDPGNGSWQSRTGSAVDGTGDLLPFACIMDTAQGMSSRNEGKINGNSSGEDGLKGSFGREGNCAVRTGTSPEAGGKTIPLISGNDVSPAESSPETGPKVTVTQGQLALHAPGEKAGLTGESVSGTPAILSQGADVTKGGPLEKAVLSINADPTRRKTAILKFDAQTEGAQPVLKGVTVQENGLGDKAEGTGKACASSGVRNVKYGMTPLSQEKGVSTGGATTILPEKVDITEGGTRKTVSLTPADPTEQGEGVLKSGVQKGDVRSVLNGIAVQENDAGEKTGKEKGAVPAGGDGGDKTKAAAFRMAEQLSESSKTDVKQRAPEKGGTALSEGTTGTTNGSGKGPPVREDALGSLKTTGKESVAVANEKISRVFSEITETERGSRSAGNKSDPLASTLQGVTSAKNKNGMEKNGSEKVSYSLGKEEVKGDGGTRISMTGEGTSAGHEQTGDRRFEERTVDSVQRGISRSTSPSQEPPPSGGYQHVASLAGGKQVVTADPVEITPRGLINQIVDGAKTSGRVRIVLNPPSLGTLDMDVLVRNNKVHVTLQAENTDIKQMLQSSMDNLRTALRSQGLTVDSIQVLAQERSDGEGFGSGRNDLWSGEGTNSGNGNEREWCGGEADLSDPASSLSEGKTRQVAHNGALNVFA